MALKLGNLLLSKKVSNPSIENPNGATGVHTETRAATFIIQESITSKQVASRKNFMEKYGCISLIKQCEQNISATDRCVIVQSCALVLEFARF